MANRLDLYDGKYTVIDELPEGGGFRALRYGEEWRSLVGDNLMYSMFCEIERLQETRKHYDNMIRNLDALADMIVYELGDVNSPERVADEIRRLIVILEEKVGGII